MEENFVVTEATFRSILATLYIIGGAIRTYYRLKVRDVSRRLEGIWTVIWRNVFAFSGAIAALMWLVDPQWMQWSALSCLPMKLRWLGVGLGVVGILLGFWAYRTLGEAFTDTIEVKQPPTLVTSGPYHWIRHPMYVALFFIRGAFFLLSTNWFIGLVGLLEITIVVSRVRREEALLIERHGPQYQAYMARTGQFLPHLGGQKAYHRPNVQAR
ncbi:MAG: isoprenylcysteine carboxylmethyltransferase family protein [Anaerolineae bacterium]|nr:isoprenylcysteine carboxylmethyltransferase family protein [Anaerolineae bacterium]